VFGSVNTGSQHLAGGKLRQAIARFFCASVPPPDKLGGDLRRVASEPTPM